VRREEKNIEEEKEIQTKRGCRGSHDRTPGRVGKDHALGQRFSQEDAAGTRTVQSHTGSASGVAEVWECELRCSLMFLF